MCEWPPTRPCLVEMHLCYLRPQVLRQALMTVIRTSPEQPTLRPSSKAETFGLLVLLTCGLLVRLVLAWTNISILIQKTLPDDAYYYFVVARNVAQGRGVTFDGLAPTNGFHPLWAVILSLLYATVRDPGDLTIHIALTVSALLDGATILLAYIIVRSTTKDPKAALLAASFYAFNPLVIIDSVNGLETALSTLLFALCSYYYLTKLRPAVSPELKKWAIFGALAGTMVLARTDTAFIFAVIMIDTLRSLKERGWTPYMITGLVFTLCLSPWLIWNQWAMGTIMQTSGVAVPYVVRQHLFTFTPERFPDYPVWIFYAAAPVYLLSILWEVLWLYCSRELLAWAGLTVGLRLFRQYLKEQGRWELPPGFKALSIPLLGAGAVLLAHTFGRWFLRAWYYVPVAFALALLTGLLVSHVSTIIKLRSKVLQKAFDSLAILTILLFLLVQGTRWWERGLYPWQEDMYRAAIWIAENTEPGDRIGAFNAGLLAYYSGRMVINLDGVVNAEAVEALKNRRLMSLIETKKIKYLFDWHASINAIYYYFFEERYQEHLVPVYVMPKRSETLFMVAYRVEG